MKVRLIIILTLFALASGAIWGGYAYLDSLVPKGDPKVKQQRDKVDGDEEFAVPAPEGAMPQAPGA